MNRRRLVLSLSTSTLAALITSRKGCLLCGSTSHTADRHRVQTVDTCVRCSTAHALTAPCPLEVADV